MYSIICDTAFKCINILMCSYVFYEPSHMRNKQHSAMSPLHKIYQHTHTWLTNSSRSASVGVMMMTEIESVFLYSCVYIGQGTPSTRCTMIVHDLALLSPAAEEDGKHNTQQNIVKSQTYTTITIYIYSNTRSRAMEIKTNIAHAVRLSLWLFVCLFFICNVLRMCV